MFSPLKYSRFADIARFVLLAGLLAVAPTRGDAADWLTFNAGEASIDYPADWAVAHQQPGREVQLSSPDGTYTMHAFWWFPDEPLLGYADIVSHEEFTLAGRRAMLITSDFGQMGVHAVAFLDPRPSGEQFLINLEFNDGDFAAAANVLDDLLSRVRYGQTRGGASKRFGTKQPAAAAPVAAAPSGERLAPFVAAVGRQIGGSCSLESRPDVLARAVPVLEGHGNARFVGMMGCSKNLPVFGADFTFDPRGQTDDYFYPLYLDLLDALGGRPFGIVSIRDRLLVRISKSRDGGLSINHFELTEEPYAAPAASVPDRPDPVAPASPNYVPTGKVLVAEIGNVGAVRNGPTKRVMIDTKNPILITSIQTYHWNHGQGWPPGTIALRDQAGQLFGPWQAYGKPGQGGVPDAYWLVEPNIVVPSGKYELIDSNPATWATNDEAKGRGFVKMHFQNMRLEVVETPAPPPPPRNVTPAPAAPVEPASTPAAVKVPLPVIAPLPDTRTERVLFNGALDTFWRPHSAHGGDYEKHASLGASGLTVDAPEGSGWAKAGIMTDPSPLWLDEFGEGAEVTVEFEIDPARTNGFVLALSQASWGGIGGNDPGKPNAVFHWRAPIDGGKAEAHMALEPKGGGENWQGEVAAIPPRNVRFVMRPGEISIEADGVPSFTRKWGQAADGAGFNIYAYSHAPSEKARTLFALRKVTTIRQPGEPQRAPEPAPGVDPLPVVTLFDGKAGDAWEGIGVAGGNFDEFARFGAGGLIVDVPEKHSWGKTGLLSVEPVVRLDERVWTTPTRLELQMDPSRPQNLNVALSGARIPDMWRDHRAWMTLSYSAEKDVWYFGLRSSPYNSWSREIAGAWMREHWDGRLWIDVGNGWAAMQVPGGPRLRANVSIGAGMDLFMVVQAHAPKENEAAQLTLQKITRGVLMPDGMTADQRWSLVDTETFDAKAFVDELAGGL